MTLQERKPTKKNTYPDNFATSGDSLRTYQYSVLWRSMDSVVLELNHIKYKVVIVKSGGLICQFAQLP